MRLGRAKNRNAKTSMVNKAVHFIVGGGLPITPHASHGKVARRVGHGSL